MSDQFVAKHGLISKGDVQVTSSVIATSFTGSLFGTSSNSISSSYSLSGSYVVTSSYAVTASYALSSSNALNAFSSSYCLSGSYFNYINFNVTASTLYTTQSIYATQSLYATQSINALTASYISGSINFNPNIIYPLTASNSISSSYSLSSSYANNSSTSSLAINSLSASYALTSSYIGSGTDNYIPKWLSNTLTSTSLVYDDGTNVGIGTISISSPGASNGLDVAGGVRARTALETDFGSLLFNAHFGGPSFIYRNAGSAANIQLQTFSNNSALSLYAYSYGLSGASVSGFLSLICSCATGYVGIGNGSFTLSGAPTNQLHVYASSDPVRLEGVQPSTDIKYVTTDDSGVLHYKVLSGTDNYLPKWSSNSLTGTSNVYDDGTNVGIGVYGSFRNPSGYSPCLNVLGGINSQELIEISTVDTPALYFNAYISSGIRKDRLAGSPPGGIEQMSVASRYFYSFRTSPAGTGNSIIHFTSSLIIDTVTAYVGIGQGTNGVNNGVPTNQLHVSGATDPVRIEGVQSATDTKYITEDNTGVLHYTSNPAADCHFKTFSGGLSAYTLTGVSSTVTFTSTTFETDTLTPGTYLVVAQLVFAQISDGQVAVIDLQDTEDTSILTNSEKWAGANGVTSANWPVSLEGTVTIVSSGTVRVIAKALGTVGGTIGPSMSTLRWMRIST